MMLRHEYQQIDNLRQTPRLHVMLLSILLFCGIVVTTIFLLSLFLVYRSKTYLLGQLVHEMIVKHFQVRVLLCFLIHVVRIG